MLHIYRKETENTQKLGATNIVTNPKEGPEARLKPTRKELNFLLNKHDQRFEDVMQCINTL